MINPVVVVLFAVSWRSLADLDPPRAGYAGGVLDGKYALAGGSFWVGNEKVRTTAFDLYEPQTGARTKGPEMPYRLSDSSSAVVDNVLYVFGGTEDGVQTRTTALRFQNGKWSEIPELRLPQGRMQAVAATDARRIFVCGGITTPLKFDTAVDTVLMCDSKQPAAGWTTLPPCPEGPFLIPSATVLADNLYLCPGSHSGGEDVLNLDSIWRLDLKSRQWTRLGRLPEPRRAMGMAAESGRLLFFGGYTNDFRRDILEYDLRTHAVRTLGELPETVADAKFFRIGRNWLVAGGEVAPKIRGKHLWEVTLP